jgi:lysozyme
MTRTPTPVMRRTLAGLTLSATALVGIVLHEGYTDRAVIPVRATCRPSGSGLPPT